MSPLCCGSTSRTTRSSVSPRRPRRPNSPGSTPRSSLTSSGLLDSRCPWLKGDPPGWLADEPAAADPRWRGRPRDVLRRQAGDAGWDHRRRRRTRAEVRRTSVGPGASARFARAGRSAGNGARLSGRGRRRDPVLAHGLAHRRPTQRAGRCLRSRRDRRRHVHARRHPSRRGDPRSTRSKATSASAARTRPPDRVDHGDSSAGETTVLDLRTIHPDDDEVVAGRSSRAPPDARRRHRRSRRPRQVHPDQSTHRHRPDRGGKTVA